MKHNVAANDATNATVYPYAVGASSGYGSLGYRRRGSAETHIVPVARGDADPVRVVSLGDFCSEQSIRPSVMKIDVEGAEAEVLSGAAAEILAQTRVAIVELHEAALRQRGSSSEELIRRLAGRGGRVVTLTVKPGNGHIAVLRAAD